MYESIHAWLDNHPTLFGVPLWAAVLTVSITTAVVSVVMTAVALVLIPANYFLGPEPPDWSSHRHPVIYWTIRIFRNTLGWLLVVAGFILSFPGIPGQGLLTILLGVMLVEFPGKHKLEQKLVSRPRVMKAVNAIRVRFGARALEMDDAN